VDALTLQLSQFLMVDRQRAGDAVGGSGWCRMVMMQWAGVEAGGWQSGARGSLVAVQRPLLHRQHHLRRGFDESYHLGVRRLHHVHSVNLDYFIVTV